MVTILQNLKTTHGVPVGEEVTGLRNDVQNVGDGVEGANNKLDAILHGALKTTHGVGEEVTGLRNDVQNVGDGVEDANNKLDAILHGAHLAFIRLPF
jgi:hypothetical protein